jgi:hypothetical protein
LRVEFRPKLILSYATWARVKPRFAQERATTIARWKA